MLPCKELKKNIYRVCKEKTRRGGSILFLMHGFSVEDPTPLIDYVKLLLF